MYISYEKYIERGPLSGYSIVLALSFQDNSVERF